MMMRAAMVLIAVVSSLMLYSCAARTAPAVQPGSLLDSVHQPESTLAVKNDSAVSDTVSAATSLSAASQLLVRTCDNYLSVNPGSPKLPEVYLLKASVYYNNRLYEQARAVYADLTEKFSRSAESIEGIRLTAQTFYEQKDFENAQNWYRKLKDAAAEGGGKTEAITRIAESIFRIAEQLETEQKYLDAAAQYERVALEFPDAVIADVSLFNAGIDYEKMSEWQRAILVYQRLKQKYADSKLAPKSVFRTSKCYEKLSRWDEAAQTYLSVVTTYPHSEFATSSLYNVGFCLENSGKLAEAGAAFERYATSLPDTKEAPDVLFKAGEVFGRLKDWSSVSRVNQAFSRRYGNDRDRVIQALCMSGVALYMEGKEGEAITQLKNAITAYDGLKEPSSANKYYAAQAQFTIGEIFHENHKKIFLTQPQEAYRRQLKGKQALLDKAVEAYSSVIRYSISEWTTRAINQIGQAYEDFAIDIFRQQRPDNLSLADNLALELGIANAFEEYLVNNALHYYEQNVKLGIREKIEDRYVLASRSKLTYASCAAGENFLKLVNIAQRAPSGAGVEGMAAIGAKLTALQQVGPFQEKAIALFLQSMELGARYQQSDEFFIRSGGLAVSTTLTAARTYKDVADIARNAPLPSGLDPYELFVYKTKLIKQIAPYEDKALGYCENAAQIAQSYSISDSSVARARQLLPEILFIRGRCYDLLCLQSFKAPPLPTGISPEEQDEYRAQFGEIALAYQEQAQTVYEQVIDDAQKGYAEGLFVNHAYARLYQTSPEDFGEKVATRQQRIITSDPKWLARPDSIQSWNAIELSDSGWSAVYRDSMPAAITISGFDAAVTPTPMWFRAPDGSRPSLLYFRRSFSVDEPPPEASFTSAAVDEQRIFINGTELQADTGLTAMNWQHAKTWKLANILRRGRNVIAVEVRNAIRMGYGLMPLLSYTENSYDYAPRFPGSTAVSDKKPLVDGSYAFPDVPNFQLASEGAGK